MDLPLGGEDEVLGQPTRALGLHANGVRRHLDRLAAAGLVERPRAYTDLSRWLARAILTTTAREREVERAGCVAAVDGAR